MMGSMGAAAPAQGGDSLLRFFDVVSDPKKYRSQIAELVALQQALAETRDAALLAQQAAARDLDEARALVKQANATEAAIADREQRMAALGTELQDREANLAAAEREFSARKKKLETEMSAREAAMARKHNEFEAATERMRGLLG